MSIKAQKGRSFSVTLSSSFGSTPYGWCLTEMPEEVMLYHQENVLTAPMSVNQIFHFIVRNTAEKKEVELKFALVDFTTAEESKSVVAPVEISEPDSANEAGADKFFEFDGNTATYNPNKLVLDYAFPAASYACDPCARPPYGVLPTSASPDCGCVSMMYYIQPQAAFASAAANLPTIPYGVFPSNVPYNPSYFYGMMPFRSGVDCGNLSMAYNVQGCSAFDNCQAPRRAYDIASSSAF